MDVLAIKGGRGMQSKSILVVEDEAGTREALAKLLQDAGYSVLTAGNGLEAFSLMRADPPPCLIILDLVMPVLDGWSFCEILQSLPGAAQVPIIVCSGAESGLRRS